MKGYKDSEFIELRNRLLLGGTIAVLVAALFILLIFKRFGFTDSLNRKIRKKENFVVYVTSRDCKNCDKIGKYLDDKNVVYESMLEDSDKAIKLFDKYNVKYNNTISPSIMYFADGKLYAFLVNVNDTEELDDFIENYNLNK